LEIWRRQPIRPDAQLAVLPRALLAGERLDAAVDLGGVPPVALRSLEGRGPAVALPVCGMTPGGGNLHRALWPVIVIGQRDLPGMIEIVAAMAQPVMHLELDPGGGKDVETRRRQESLAGEELTADGARVGLQDLRRRLRLAGRGWDVAAE